MKKPAIRILPVLLAGACSASLANAAVVESPDDVCAPAANPCIVSTLVEVDGAFPLDFGLRTVRVTETGQFQGTLDLSCGAFESVTTGTWMKILDVDGGGFAMITASRGCSLNPALPCMSDTVCADAGAGVCSSGDGGIRLSGRLTGVSSGLALRAAGDVALEGEILQPGISPFPDGGNFTVESAFGSIESAARVDLNSGVNDGYYGGLGFGGSVLLRAAKDVTLREQIAATGGYAEIEIDAGRDIIVLAGILAQGRQGDDSNGGTIDLSAAQDLRIIREAGLVAPQLNITGGTEEFNDYYYGYVSGGAGGYGFFNSGRDLVVGEKVTLLGDSGESSGVTDVTPLSGDWYFEAGEDLSFDATLTARAWGRYGYALHGVSLYGDESVHVGRRGTIATNASRSGDVAVVSSNAGPISIDGRINVKGRKIRYYGYTHGTGGNVSVRGGDVTIKGKIQNGGPSYAGEMRVDACRLRLKAGGRFDGKWGQQYEGTYGSTFYIGESMKTYAGSGIRAKEGAIHRIEYRDAAKPPVLAGLVTPAPTLVVNPGLGGCPVCGNLEIDQDETCDDGNVLDGDGCDSSCVLEP